MFESAVSFSVYEETKGWKGNVRHIDTYISTYAMQLQDPQFLGNGNSNDTHPRGSVFSSAYKNILLTRHDDMDKQKYKKGSISDCIKTNCCFHPLLKSPSSSWHTPSQLPAVWPREGCVHHTKPWGWERRQSQSWKVKGCMILLDLCFVNSINELNIGCVTKPHLSSGCHWKSEPPSPYHP